MIHNYNFFSGLRVQKAAMEEYKMFAIKKNHTLILHNTDNHII